MKMMMYTFAALLAVASALAAQPGHGDTVQTDASLKFMRRKAAHLVAKEDPVLDAAQKGPNAEDDKAQKADDKVANGKATVADQVANPVVKAGEAVGDAVSDGYKAVQKAENAAVGAVGDAVTDGVKDAQTGPNDEKKPQGKDNAKEATPSEKEGQQAPEGIREEPEDKEVPSVPGCKNSPKGWQDTKGNDCEDYAEGEFCTQRGGYGDAWLDEWGTFEDVTNKGKSPKQACCICGGGFRKDDEVAGAPAPGGAAAPIPEIKPPILGTKIGRPLQEQGYSGDPVAFEDQQSMTEDWGKEFGPHSAQRNIKVICEEHPGNEWCSLHGYYDRPKESGAASTKLLLAMIVASVMAFLR